MLDLDAYAILGLGRHATDEAIRARRRHLLRDLHPDAADQSDAEAVAAQTEAAARINAATDTLLDPSRRADLDLSLDRATDAPRAPSAEPRRSAPSRPAPGPQWSDPTGAWQSNGPPPGFPANTDPNLFSQWWHEIDAEFPVFAREFAKTPDHYASAYFAWLRERQQRGHNQRVRAASRLPELMEVVRYDRRAMWAVALAAFVVFVLVFHQGIAWAVWGSFLLGQAAWARRWSQTPLGDLFSGMFRLVVDFLRGR